MPAGTRTRPTSDRVRGAIFNSLGSADLILGRTVLDLFAGSGALGIEALSRGASHATFVESDRAAVVAIGDNLSSMGLTETSRVEAMTAERFLERAGNSVRFDLAFLDPPYAYDAWAQVLAALPADAIVAESDREIDLGDGWDVRRTRSYGSTVVTIATRRPPSVG